ncbi:hypothetical protein [Psychrobacter namhaensis]
MNPDGGLKTRHGDEVRLPLRNVVEMTRTARQKYAA